MSFKVLQISDCHVAGDPDELYRGLDARAGLDAILRRAREWQPDLLLLTGDASEDASTASYEWLAARLAASGYPLLAVPGNHDDAPRMRRHLPGTVVGAPLARDLGGWRLVLLDSSVPGEVPGRLGRPSLERLDAVLGESDSPSLVALHHQPLPMGSPWIDRYPLLDPEPFWEVLGQHRQVRMVLWGHVHHALEFEVNGIAALACPSTASNSLAYRKRFTPDPAGPACRWLELDDGGAFATGVWHAGG